MPFQQGENTGGLALQEVAPPAGVQQIREALDAHEPRVRILSPQDDDLVRPGPWSLRLRLEDWPLVDAGPLGLGPHLVVQLDGEAPLRLTSLEAIMPPLTPGSHKLTVYAARPWGEAVKSPGAYQQIRVHRAAPNPISLPPRGTPQMIPVSPDGDLPGEPVLLDWLLLDGPLQDLLGGEGGWRLRVTVNDDSFLIDRQTPIWLRGWRKGTNTILLELVDRRGEPLNPPFNSQVREIHLSSAEQRPPWLGGRLTAADLARLLGEAPPEAEEPSAAGEAAMLPDEGGDENLGDPEDNGASELIEQPWEQVSGEEMEEKRSGSGVASMEEDRQAIADQVEPAEPIDAATSSSPAAEASPAPPLPSGSEVMAGPSSAGGPSGTAEPQPTSDRPPLDEPLWDDRPSGQAPGQGGLGEDASQPSSPTEDGGSGVTGRSSASSDASQSSRAGEPPQSREEQPAKAETKDAPGGKGSGADLAATLRQRLHR